MKNNVPDKNKPKSIPVKLDLSKFHEDMQKAILENELAVKKLSNSVLQFNKESYANQGMINLLLSKPKPQPQLKKLSLKVQTEEVFIKHQASRPGYSSYGDKIEGCTKVFFLKNAIKSQCFFGVATTLVQAASQKASGLPPEMWFTILSYLCLTQGEYLLSDKLTQGYEVLMKLRIILDCYSNRTNPLTIEHSLSFDEFQNKIPAEAKRAFSL